MRNVTDMFNTYRNCHSLAENAYFYSNNVSNVRNCFGIRDISKMINIYAPANSTTMTTLLYNNMCSLVGKTCTWTNDIAVNGCYYNTAYNICIYPVENVSAARIANGD